MELSNNNNIIIHVNRIMNVWQVENQASFRRIFGLGIYRYSVFFFVMTFYAEESVICLDWVCCVPASFEICVTVVDIFLILKYVSMICKVQTIFNLISCTNFNYSNRDRFTDLNIPCNNVIFLVLILAQSCTC